MPVSHGDRQAPGEKQPHCLLHRGEALYKAGDNTESA